MNNKNAWELARMIIGSSEDAFSKEQLQEIFSGYNEPYDILNNYTFDECKKKIEDWEKSRCLKAGDIVIFESDDILGVILDFSDNDNNIYYVYTENGCVEEWDGCRIKKSPRHIELHTLFE